MVRNLQNGTKMTVPPADVKRDVHLPTVIAIAVVVYALASFLHEGIGHGGACLLVGGNPTSVTTVYFESNTDALSRWNIKLIKAGGTLVNLLAGFLGLMVLRKRNGMSPTTRYFFWLFMTVNLLTGGGYFLFSGIANIGDWASFVNDFPHAWAWHIGLTVLGAVSYLTFVYISLIEFGKFAGGKSPEQFKLANKLSLIPYISGGILSVLAGMLNPKGMIFVAISAAAASFGGTSGLAWMMSWFRNAKIPKVENSPLQIPLSWGWIVTGIIVSFVFIFVLGRGVQFN